MYGSDGTIAGGRLHPFGRGTLGAAWGDLVAIGVQDSYEIKAFAADGSLVRIVRRDGDPGQPTRADLDAYWEQLYADMSDDQRTRGLSLVKDMPLVDSYPAFEEILGDRSGYLWVREYRAPGAEGAMWTVFDPEGRIQGLAETPPGLRVYEIGEDYLLGRMYDQFVWSMCSCGRWTGVRGDRRPRALLITTPRLSPTTRHGYAPATAALPGDRPQGQRDKSREHR